MSMMSILKLAAALIAGYLIGSFSFSITISKLLFGKDVRENGSGNAGATNMARSYGILPGVLTLTGDFLKCALSITLGHILFQEWGMTAAGIGCVTGHCFPLYYGFKGGKGVAVALAVAFTADWRAGIVALVIFAIVAIATKKVSLASLCTTVGTYIFMFFIGTPMHILVLGGFTVVLIFVRHIQNIKRLARHEEQDFKAGGKE